MGTSENTAAKTSPPSSVSKALRLLMLLAQAKDPVPLKDAAAQAELTKPSTHRLLAELIDEGYVESVGRGTYRPGPGLRVLAAAMEGHSGYGIPTVLQALATDTSHTVLLAVPSGPYVTFTHKAQPTLPYSMSMDVGDRAPLRSSAAGLAILAHLPVGHGADPEGDTAPAIDAEPMPVDLAEVRKRGFTVEFGEVDPLLGGVAAPVFDSDHVPVASVVLMNLTIATTKTKLRRLGPAAIAAAEDVASRL